MKEPISPEYLNAFVDDELAAGERERALTRLAEDDDFKRAVCEGRTLKEMVRGAYAEVRPAPARAPSMGGALRQALAAGLLLALGAGGGWLARDIGAGSDATVERLAGLPEGYRAVSLATRVDPDKIVLHLDSGDSARLAASLEIAERLLRQRGADARVEVVVNSYGLDLLRLETPHRQVIERLAEEHANLSFVACGQTIARLKREGVEARLIPQAGVASSAINEITTRMGQGWVYVKV